jgi:tetratricopeptide (TPR) repeat protein
LIGTVLGSYEILEKVGEGGVATVYRAHQPNMGRDVAIKVITGAMGRDDAAVQRFQREARLIARLEHAHILPVYDFDGGHEPPYIVMRYLDSGTLGDVLERGKLSAEEVIYLLRQVGSALDYAHRQGIVHRDVKPSNILIDREGNAFVADFGIARMTSSDSGAQITVAGAIVGTPGYMSPEQVMGGDDVDHRADIYALGVVLFEMLTGQLPYIADTLSGLLMMHIQEPVPSAVERCPDLCSEVDEVIVRALAKDPAQRYASAVALTEALAAALGGKVSDSPARLRQAVRDSLVSGQARRAASSSETPSEQNKMVSALYANAAEYAEIVDQVEGGQAARQAMDALWEASERVVEVHGGLVLSRTEEAMLALWGADAAREDDTQRAIRAALAIQATLREQGAAVLVEEEDEPLPLGIGIHTGLALLTPDAESGAYTASGATLSLANRLMQQAGGAILITHDTYNQVRGVFDVEPDIPLRARRGRGASRQGTLKVYRVLAAKARAFHRSARGVEGVETRMVGRESELKLLQDAFLDAVEERETQVVTVVGGAGLGKSRLLFEFTEWSDLHPEQFWLLRGRARPEMTQRPYALLRDLLSFRFEIHDNDSPAEVRTKLERGIEGQIGQDGEMAHLIGHLAGYDLSDSPFVAGLLADAQQLTRRARQLFIRWARELCARNPVVMELDDIHHADDASLDLLSALVSAEEDLPLLVICLARPSLFARRPAWGSGQDYHTRLELRPLGKRESRGLAREILRKVDQVPKAMRDLLVARAEGNPYYMEELVKTLIDERVIVKDSDDAWRVEATRIDHISVPATLLGLLQARLDSLLYPEKLTLQRAAVVGRVFYDSTLAALDAADETHLDDLPGILRQLTEHGFIHARETTAFEGSVEYSFAGAMLRDVLEDTLLRSQRRSYNAAAAGWLIQASAERVDEYGATIAEYYQRAGEGEKAAYYLRRAGQKALLVGVPREARALFERALALLPKGAPEGLPLRLRLGEACCLLGEYPAAREALTDALEEARGREEGGYAADAHYWLGQVAGLAEGEYAGAQGHLEASLSLARAGDDRVRLARALYGLGDVHWRLGDLDAARTYCEDSLALARQLGDVAQELYALNRLGVLAHVRGDPDKGQCLLEETHALALQTGNRERAGAALNNLGEIARQRGDIAAAQEYYRQALSIIRETGEQDFVSLVLLNLVGGFIRLDDLAAAQRHLREGLALAVQIGSIPLMLMSVVCAGWLLAVQGQNARGLALLRLSLSHPASFSDIERDAEDVLAQLGLDASDPAVVAGLEAGQALDLKTVTAELLAELGEVEG